MRASAWPLASLQAWAIPRSSTTIRCSTVRRYYASVSAADLKFGQPVHETHPHLLKAGEVTPGISALEYAQRRDRLAERLPDGAIAVLTAAPIKYRAGVVFYDFHQDSDFFYLTGFNEPEAVAVIEKAGRLEGHKFHLYVQPKDDKAQLWEGARSGIQAAEDVFNADQAGNVEDIKSILPAILDEAEEIYTDIPITDQSAKTTFQKFFQRGPKKAAGFSELMGSSTVKKLKPVVNELRAIKSDNEIANMRIAGKASGRAFTEAMRRKFTGEKDLAAFLDYEFRMRGCDSSAYVPVIAGGDNALSIHYVQNNALLREGDLVLVDAGGQYGGYVTDITRTWPVKGHFSSPQRDLYQAVLNVQRTCISMCREDGNISLDRLHKIARTGLGDQLRQLGFDFSENDINEDLYGLFPHHVGHYLGLDLHDTPGYPRSQNLVSGQCITIEPGIYVPNDERWPAHFRGIGIRIEDSVCVQQESPFVLTTEAVKEIVDIEALSQ